MVGACLPVFVSIVNRFRSPQNCCSSNNLIDRVSTRFGYPVRSGGGSRFAMAERHHRFDLVDLQGEDIEGAISHPTVRTMAMRLLSNPRLRREDLECLKRATRADSRPMEVRL